MLLIECQATCFKNSSYIFSKKGRDWDRKRDICSSQGGVLVSIETEEEWQFIKSEIQKRGTWISGARHISLEKEGGVWTWLSGNNWKFQNGEILSLVVRTTGRKYLRMEASLMVSLYLVEMPTFARCLEVRSHSSHKVYNELRHDSLALVSWKLLLLPRSKTIVHRIYSAHLTGTSERWMNFKARISGST